MRILWVLENYHPMVGGVETLFKRLEEQLCQRGHSLIILTGRPSKTFQKTEKGENYRIIRMPFRNRYLFTFFAFPWVWWYARQAELVHTTSYNAGLPAFIGAKLRRKKVLITFHEAWGRLWFRLPFISPLAKYLHYTFEQMLLRLPFDRFVAVSHATAQRLREEGVNPDKIRMIYNGLDPKPETRSFEDSGQNPKPETRSFEDSGQDPKPSPPFIFTYYGRLGISKGLDLLLPAAKLLKEKRADWRLRLIVPRHPAGMLKWVKTYIRKNELETLLELRHSLSREQLHEAVGNSNCVVIPSYSEGFCFVAAESMAWGVPIISSGQGALKEVVGGKMLSMNRLDAASLVDSMEKALMNQWEEKPLKKFELAPQLEAYEALYSEMIQS